MTVEWHGDERREGYDFNVRSAILAEIAKTDDSHLKTILLLMFGVLEQGEKGLQRIEQKIDKVLKDEQAIKKLALNGHEMNHHEHHDWIADRIKNGGHCQWAIKKQQQEAEATQNKKSLVMKFMESIVSHVGTAVAVGLIAYFTLRT